MGRGVMSMTILLGMTLGGFLPGLWGAGDFSLSSLLCSALGGLAGVWAGVRLSA
jgi:hypothetical protein